MSSAPLATLDALGAAAAVRSGVSSAVEIVEASPEQLCVKNVDYGYEADFGKTFFLAVPPGEALRRQ